MILKYIIILYLAEILTTDHKIDETINERYKKRNWKSDNEHS